MTQIGWLYNEEMNTWAPGEITAASGGLPAGGTTGQVLTKVSDADGDADWEPGGSSQTVHEELNGNAVSVPNLSSASLTWNTHLSGDVLLDLSDTAHPTVIEGGVYAVSALVGADDVMTADGVYRLTLSLDDDNIGATARSWSGPSIEPDFTQPQVSVSLCWYIPTDGVIVLGVVNLDGASAISFHILDAYVQRIA